MFPQKYRKVVCHISSIPLVNHDITMRNAQLPENRQKRDIFRTQYEYASNHNGIRVYIAKITFTTLIDHFTSYMPQGTGL